MMHTIIAWSGGKDSYLALSRCLRDSSLKVVALFTRCLKDLDRNQMHGIRLELLRIQADTLGLPLYPIMLDIPNNSHSHNSIFTAFPSNAHYVEIMNSKLSELKNKLDLSCIVFGDLRPPQIIEWQQKALQPTGLKLLFPLMGTSSTQIAQEFIEINNAKACIVCVDSTQVNGMTNAINMVGKNYTRKFIDELPTNVDCAGENGEFHTFVYSGSLFKRPVQFIKKSKTIQDARFVFYDLTPSNNNN